jgi:type II secretory pathway pseudopilin PulG
MAALLVALAVMAVMMSVAMPVWRHEAQRRKEDELIWRGNQYVRAIRLYQSKFGTFPPNYDVLVSGSFLRKRYKDPIANDDFDPIGAGNPQAGVPGGFPGRMGQPPQTLPTTPSTSQPTPTALSASNGAVPGGLIGVRSKSKDESIKLYQGRSHYNEWTFIYVNQNPGGPGRGGPQRGRPGPDRPGTGAPGSPGPGPGRGNPNGPGRGFGPGTGIPTTFPPGFPPNPGRRGGGL